MRNLVTRKWKYLRYIVLSSGVHDHMIHASRQYFCWKLKKRGFDDNMIMSTRLIMGEHQVTNIGNPNDRYFVRNLLWWYYLHDKKSVLIVCHDTVYSSRIWLSSLSKWQASDGKSSKHTDTVSISDHIVRFLLYFSNIRLYFESKLIGPVQLKIRQTENQVDPDFPAHLSDVDNDFFFLHVHWIQWWLLGAY